MQVMTDEKQFYWSQTAKNLKRWKKAKTASAEDFAIEQPGDRGHLSDLRKADAKAVFDCSLRDLGSDGYDEVCDSAGRLCDGRKFGWHKTK